MATDLITGMTSRSLPTAVKDNPDSPRPVRLGPYGDVKVESGWATDHLLADEGAYIVATSLPAAATLQVGIQSAYVATQAFIVIGNGDPAGGRRIFPKWIRMTCAVAGTSGVDLRYAVVLDSIDRTPSVLSTAAAGFGPGTAADQTAYRVKTVCTNMAVNPQVASKVYFGIGLATSTGAATVPNVSANSRVIVGNGSLKPSIPVVKDQYVIQFGSADIGGTFQAAAALAKIVDHAPACVLGPGQFLTFHLWSAGNGTAGNAFDDVAVGVIER